MNHSNIDGRQVAETIGRFRATQPHVHCITNTAAQAFTANVLLAVDCTPSMTIASQEVADFVGMADALLVNLGTMDPERNIAVERAIAAAKAGGKPWALDPVFVQASPIRLELAKRLLDENPTLVRCNWGEGSALLDIEPDSGQMQKAAAGFGGTLVLTGLSDTICNHDGALTIENGSHTMTQITAMGCALTALMAGFLAIEDNHLLAATSAAAYFGLAGDVAEQISSGPGSFVPAFLDALHNLTMDEIAKGVILS